MVETDTLLRSLERAMRDGHPAQLLIGGTGTVSLYPRQRCYVTDIQDWDTVFGARPDQIRLAPTAWTTAPAGALPIEHLQWRAAWRAAGDRRATGELVSLVSWPNVTRLPGKCVAPVTRICALLWRKPTVGYLVARMLDIPAEEGAACLHALRIMGHVQWTDSARPAIEPVEEPQPVPASATSQRAANDMRFVARLWHRLTGA